MNASPKNLLHELLEFQIDEPGTDFTFARRLARENGWSLAYAERVIVEYKKFLFLAVEAGHVVTPSEQVDQAWHLHLTYTRSYWDDLCRSVLCRPLHHGPTKGGAVEQARFFDLYQQTLSSYRRLLGETPPRDIWPPAKQRFGVDLQRVNVNTARNWIIPKPRWPSMVSGPEATSALCLVGLPLAMWNPLDWTGPVFLRGYILLAACRGAAGARDAAAFGSRGHRRQRQKPGAARSLRNCLSRGRTGASGAGRVCGHGARGNSASRSRGIQRRRSALQQAGLQHAGLRQRIAIRQGLPLPKNSPRLERQLYDAAANPSANLATLTAAAAPVVSDIKDDLIERGLLHDGIPSAGNAMASLIMAAPLLLGVAKIAVGLERGRPVGFLIAACIATAIAALGFLLARRRLTSRGREVLGSLQDKYRQMTRLEEPAAIAMSPTELGLTVGLFGAGMLATGPLTNVHAMLSRPSASGGGGCGAIGGTVGGAVGGAGCGGDGGGGGGGCGGGGCGGCGGCGG